MATTNNVHPGAVEKIAELYYNFTMKDKEETPGEFIFVDFENDVALRKIFGAEKKKGLIWQGR